MKKKTRGFGSKRLSETIIKSDNRIKEILLSNYREEINKQQELCPGNCWIWTGPLTTEGYGTIYTGKINNNIVFERAHRASYRIFNNIKIVNQILHKCGNQRCINPDHLYDGSALDNYADQIAHGTAANLKYK